MRRTRGWMWTIGGVLLASLTLLAFGQAIAAAALIGAALIGLEVALWRDRSRGD